jgi:hypothetical protein
MELVWNARIVFYRCLQELSDDVIMPSDQSDAALLRHTSAAEDAQKKAVALGARSRYFHHLMMQMQGRLEAKCAICNAEVDSLVLTDCGVGYFFCLISMPCFGCVALTVND